MFNIRRSVFETNSSSMHSLVIVKKPKPYTKDELNLFTYNGEYEFNLFYDREDANYERAPYRVLRTPLDKLKYYSAYILGTCNKLDKIGEIKNFINQQTGIDQENINLEHVETHYTRSGKEIETRDYGYVSSNDSGEDVFDFVKRKNIDWKDLILNPKYVIIVDGDEYQLFKALFKSNILDANDFEDISSGPDFWNDSEKRIYLSWFENNPYGNTAEYYTEDISEFIKVLKFVISIDTYKLYNKNEQLIKDICELARKKNPNIKIILESDSTEQKKVKSVSALDTSMFDEVRI